MRKKLLIILIASSLALFACSTRPPTPVASIASPTSRPALPLPAQVATRDVDVDVDSQGNVTLTPEEFEDLAWNLSEIYRWIKEARFQLDYYRAEPE